MVYRQYYFFIYILQTQQMVLQSAQELKACRLTVEAEQRLALTQRLDASETCNKQLKQKLEVSSIYLCLQNEYQGLI
jgi:hypothetical protein